MSAHLAFSVLSGWLTGKIRRDIELSTLDGSSRIAWTSQEKGRATQAFADYNTFGNEKTWSLLDSMETIGNKYGGYKSWKCLA